jgi:hypothetical protein
MGAMQIREERDLRVEVRQMLALASVITVLLVAGVVIGLAF